MMVLERDIESALYAAPDRFPIVGGMFHLKKWLARQYPIPSGRIDLLGLLKSEVDSYSSLAVVEIKRGRLDANALSQVCRYAADIESIGNEISCKYGTLTVWHKVEKVLVGGDIDRETLLAANGLGITLLQYGVTQDISIVGRFGFQADDLMDRTCKLIQLTEDSPFEDWVREASAIGATWGKQ